MKSKSHISGFGKLGEEAAASYLESKGYEILERNWRTRRGEIDIICQKKDCLIFVEVKSVLSSTDWYPGDRINSGKQEKLILTAQKYLQENAVIFDEIRFDAILMTKATRNSWSIEHIKDAFRA